MPREYRLNDVISETGATFAQVKEWVGLGLLPKVELRGRYTVYSQDYVDRIRRIMADKEHNVTYADLRDRYDPAPDP